MDDPACPGQYRGRRRVPAPQRNRLAAVMASALVGAGMVAGLAGAVLPDHARPFGFSAVAATSEMPERGGGSDERASRNQARNTGQFNQPAPEVWLLPTVGYQISSLYEMRWGTMHNGVDLAAREGTPIHAAAAGVVSLCKWNGGYGYNVQIDHGGNIRTIYGHASVLKCREGQKVQAGDLVALIGNTGNSYGAHLHFQVEVNGKPVEPLAFMRKHGVDLQTKAQAIYGDKVG